LDDNITTNLRGLWRGLIQDNLREAFLSYKTLYRIGTPVIPFIREAVLRRDWQNVRHKSEVRLLCGLISLVHDIDERASKELSLQVVRSGCPASLRHALNSICSFTVEDFLVYNLHGVSIYEQKRLLKKQELKPILNKCLALVPQADLQGIERLYVIGPPQTGYLGTYTPFLTKIAVVWDNPYSALNPLSWLALYQFEYVLYHEIGHHLYRHTFGQDQEQEKEADEYADCLMMKKIQTSQAITCKVLRVAVRLLDALGLRGKVGNLLSKASESIHP
jgi:hypothetical protein